MFGIGMPEMLLILAVALIVFGPKRLPELAKSLGRALGEFKRATSDLKQNIETETGLDEVRGSLDDVKKDIKAQVDLDDPAPAASVKTAVSETDTPLDKVKTAFDEMNAPSGRSAATADAGPESEAEQPVDPNSDSQETKAP